MTGISNINLVIQQGDSARDAQQVKSSHQAASQIAASIQPDKQLKERTQVQQSQNASKSRWQKEKREENKKSGTGNKGKDGKGGKRNRRSNSDHILDTIV